MLDLLKRYLLNISYRAPSDLFQRMGGAKTRLIFHLSYPRKGNTSVNANTPAELCKVKYNEFDQAVKRCIEEGIGCAIAKSDMSSAFRNLGILKKHWPYLIMKAVSPFDRQTYYFIDKCLPFGASIRLCSLPSIFKCDSIFNEEKDIQEIHQLSG